MSRIQDWASLDADLVELIGWRVLAGDLQDYVRFRAACSHWSASTVCPHILDPRFHPRRWMMLPEGHGLYPGHPDLRGFVRFLNLSTGALVRAHLPLLDDHVILDSVDGLLLLHRDRDTAMRLLHPFTSEIVDLPPLASLLPQVETLRFYHRSLTMNPYASVSVSSRGAVTVMLAFTDLDRVAYATDGDQQWTLWEPFMSLLSSDLSKKSLLSSNGKIYMVEYAYQSQKVHIYRVDPPCTTAADGFPHFPLLMKIAECPLDRFSIIVNLVECGSEILLVAYNDESCLDLAVYRLADLVIGRFVPITSIGNYALVLGERCLCVLLSPNKWLPSVSPNSVICIHNYQSGQNAGEFVFEQYSLGTGIWTPASDGDLVEMPPPSPHEFTHHVFTCCYRRYW
jgi:hypothetical protein